MYKVFHMTNRIRGGGKLKNQPERFKMAADSRWPILSNNMMAAILYL